MNKPLSVKRPKRNAIDDELPIPAIRGSLAENIGRFMLVWNILERELDGSFHTIFHTDPTIAICLYANLQAKQKLIFFRLL